MAVYTVFKSAPNNKKPGDDPNDKDIRSRQIDELIRLSEDARKDVYGPNDDEDSKNFYQLFERTRRMPTFRPRIAAPQLQLMLLSEAADLTDANVRVFIRKQDERDKQKEKAFQRHWAEQFFNLQLLMAQVYSQFGGTAFLQGGYDPFAKYGRGNAWLRARMKRNVYCDPISPWPEDWSWQIIEDEVYLDQLEKETPDHTEAIARGSTKSASLAGSPAGPLELPPGPMSTTVRGLPGGENVMAGGPLKRRILYCLDRTVRKPNDEETNWFKKNNKPVPERVLKYPEGRMIVDVEGTILADGDSWLPLGDMWPAVPVWAVPPWDTVWAPAPMKYTKSLQDAAEQQMTNTFENAKRLNNGLMIIHASTGLTANSIGGLPGEVAVVSANSPPGQGVDIKFPPPFPAQMITLPQMWLGLQKELRGYTPARQGNLNPGNVGPDLFEAAVTQSQAGTRLTARLFAWSVQKAVELLFFIMAKGYSEDRVFWDKDERFDWKADPDTTKYTVQVPEGSIRPMSQSALRAMVIELKKAGMVDTRHALELLDIPDAAEIAETVENELKLAALAKQKGR